MTAQEVLDLLQSLGFAFRVRDGKILLSPAAKVTPEIRDLVLQHKGSLLEILEPGAFLNIRSKLVGLEKAARINEPGLSRFIIVLKGGGHYHSKIQIEAVKLRVIAEIPDSPVVVMDVGSDTRPCVVCEFSQPPTEAVVSRQGAVRR